MNPLTRRGWMRSLVRPALGASLVAPWSGEAGAESLPAADAPSARVHDVRRYGARGGGATLDTAAVQAAIDACGARLRRAVALAVAFAATVAFAAEKPPAAAEAGWRPLFNGRDLSGWDTWLGIPHASVQGLEVARNAEGKYTEPLGLNVDPKHVFTVTTVDGAPAIRISGEIFGALTSRDEWDDFHVRLEFKWGEKKWPPKTEVVRDSGLLYYAVGEQGGADNKTWMRSLECQIQEHDTGDFWAVGGTSADVAVQVTGEGKERRAVYTPGAPVVTMAGDARRAIKSLDNEKPSGEWNTVEVLCVRGTCVHAVNGKVNLVLRSPQQPGPHGGRVPLMKGRIQIQSEGAEVYYRNIAVRPLSDFPKAYAP